MTLTTSAFSGAAAEAATHTHSHTQRINVDVLYLSQGCNGSGLALDSFKHKGLVVGWYQQRRKTTFINNL